MTTLLIQTESTPLKVHLPSTLQMSDEQFYAFCLGNPDLRIERSATGDVIIMPPAFSDTGNRNVKISQQLANWSDQDGTGESFDPVQDLPFQTAQLAPQMPLGSN